MLVKMWENECGNREENKKEKMRGERGTRKTVAR
jgi:hypothetical protein